MKIEVNLTHALVDGKYATWKDLIAASQQQDQSLASKYRQILSACLPDLKQAESEAYQRYTRSSVTTRTNAHGIGHGGWSTGPSRESQNEWYAWRDLVRQIQSSAKSKNS